jgi:two-component system response regulator FlrC
VGHRILIVDGNELVRRSLRDTLESVGFEVDLAVGEDAMDVLEARAIEVVLNERLLPHMDGFSLVWCIKKDHPDLPVIVMTGSNAFPVIVEAMQLGADDYLVKPFDATTLVNSVQRAIDSRARTIRGRGH